VVTAARAITPAGYSASHALKQVATPSHVSSQFERFLHGKLAAQEPSSVQQLRFSH
jgi:hypothetical protein